MVFAVFKGVVAIFGIVMILIGIITAPSPIPFGIVFIAIGFFLLTATAPGLVRWLRRRWRWLDRRLKELEKRLPNWLAQSLRQSNADDEQDDDEHADDKRDDERRAANPLR